MNKRKQKKKRKYIELIRINNLSDLELGVFKRNIIFKVV